MWNFQKPFICTYLLFTCGKSKAIKKSLTGYKLRLVIKEIMQESIKAVAVFRVVSRNNWSPLNWSPVHVPIVLHEAYFIHIRFMKLSSKDFRV